jgi:urease subunit gamma/beta
MYEAGWPTGLQIVQNRHVDLTPSEQDRLLLFTAGQLAQARLTRGLKLNKPEAIAMISNAVVEAARAGATHIQAIEAGQRSIKYSDLMPGIAPLLTGIAIEAVFDDGRRLVVINFPQSEISEAEYAGQVVRLENFQNPSTSNISKVKVKNESNIAISVTSHMHFLEINPKLKFNRELAYGMRANIPSGTHVDFPPNQIIEVELTPIQGDRILIGFAGIVDGALDAPGMRETAMQRIIEFGYLTGEPS